MERQPDTNEDDQPKRSFRDWKKSKIKDSIQREALRLFREQGYEATTVEQIADAAEISRITFFRYFPTKADVVASDIFDLSVLEACRMQPAELNPIQALRVVLRETFVDCPASELEQMRERHMLLFTVPALREAMQNRMTSKVRLVARMIAERTHQNENDFAVLTLAGIIIGVGLAAGVGTKGDHEDGLMERYYALLDAGLSYLETRLSLQDL
jgi:AcrR family transcriptional regulator